MAHDAPYLSTPAEIRLVRELAPGWKDVWERICIELLGRDGKGRLFLAARNYAVQEGNISLVKDENQLEEFVSFIYKRFQERVLKKTLFAAFDSEQGDDVYAWLCNLTNIKWACREYRNEYRAHKARNFTDLDDETGTSSLDTFPASRRFSKSVEQGLEALCLKLCDEASLRFSVEKGKIGRTTEQAGLQLYRRLDRLDEMIRRLIDHVHAVVSKVRPETENRDTPDIIENEHRQSEVRICAKCDGYSNYVYDAESKAYRRISERKNQESHRKLHEATLELKFFPLDAEQVMRLLNIRRNNADQILKRYRAELPRFLPLDDEEKLLLDSLDIYNDERGDDHE